MFNNLTNVIISIISQICRKSLCTRNLAQYCTIGTMTLTVIMYWTERQEISEKKQKNTVPLRGRQSDCYEKMLTSSFHLTTGLCNVLPPLSMVLKGILLEAERTLFPNQYMEWVEIREEYMIHSLVSYSCEKTSMFIHFCMYSLMSGKPATLKDFCSGTEMPYSNFGQF